MNKQVEDMACVIHYQLDIEIDWSDAVRIAEALYDHGCRLQEEEDDEQAD